MNLEQALLDALRPRSMRERVRLRLVGGWTAAQVMQRLTPDQQQHVFGNEKNEVVAVRQALDVVWDALIVLGRSGRVSRRSVAIRAKDGRGARDVKMDVFVLATSTS